MKINARVLIPGPIEAVFDFLDDAANTVSLGSHAADHASDVEEIARADDGRRTFDIKMAAGPRRWTQTVEQTDAIE